MDCPDCGATVEAGAPAVARVDRCPRCRWTRLAGIAGGGAEEVRPGSPPAPPPARPRKRRWFDRFDRDDRRCVLCGKSREQVRKIILGAHGGVCLECVELCNDILAGEAARGGAGG